MWGSMGSRGAALAILVLAREDADIPIIAMTADAFSEDIQKCLECGMNDHLAKPIDVQAAAHKLKNIWEGGHGTDGKKTRREKRNGQAGPGISRGPLIGVRRPQPGRIRARIF